MLEYLFLRNYQAKFANWLNQYSIAYQLDVNEDIEEKYDQLLEENTRLVDAEDNIEDVTHNVDIQFTHSDGTIGQVRIKPELANRIQPCMNSIESQAFVHTIVNAVEDGTYRRLCEKQVLRMKGYNTPTLI